MMKMQPWRALFVGGLATVIGLGFVGQVLAQTAPPASPASPAPSERLRMGLEFSQDLFQSLDLGAAAVNGMGDMGAAFADVKGRPDWEALFKQSAVEELNQDRPKISRYLGRMFADYFTEAELRVALKMMSGPAGADLARIMSATAKGEKPPPISPEGTRALAQLSREPGAQTFFVKFSKVDSIMKPFEEDIVPMVLPGIFKRFGEKTQAEEDARAAANGG